MAATLHIIASCTDRKRAAAGTPVRLRDVPGSDRGRAKKWWRTLRQSDAKETPATELYVGAHWSVVRDLPRLAGDRGLDARLWVSSAGYGLVPSTRRLKPYSATFAIRQPDSIAPELGGREARRAHMSWWSALAELPLVGSKEPRSVTDLARHSRHAVILVVGSPDYVAAMRSDLLEAREELRDARQLIVISSDRPSHLGDLRENLAPSDARLLQRFGEGTRISLHALTARAMIDEVASHPLRADVQRARFERLLASPSSVRATGGTRGEVGRRGPRVHPRRAIERWSVRSHPSASQAEGGWAQM